MTRLHRFVYMLLISTLCLPMLGLESVEARASDATRVLLLSGANNHDWKQTTPALERIYKDSGQFTVDVVDDASTWTSEGLAKYDVIVSNWTNFPSQDRVWGPEAEAAFLDFVSQGKGFVLFHAASACFNTWPQYQRLIGSTWGPKTGHGARHQFNVCAVDSNHPITAGMPGFSIFDELWHRTAKQPSAQPLCQAYSSVEKGGSGLMEPVAFCSEYGQGRCFNLVLGHDVQAMDHLGWIMLMLRGTQWAATGNVTLEVPFDLADECRPVAEYKKGQDRAAFARLNDLTRFASGFPELRDALADTLAGALTGEATQDAKDYFLTQLTLIGSVRHVPVLVSLLADPRLNQQACFALEAIGGAESANAMIESLPTLQGPLLAGVIHSLGQSQMPGVVPALAPYVTSSDVDAARAAIKAMAQVGGPQAAQVLIDSAAQVSGPLRSELAHALLRCADGLEPSRKEPLYRSLVASAKEPAPVRRAAFVGLVACQPSTDQAAGLLIGALVGDDRDLRTAALTRIRRGPDPQVRHLVAHWIPNAPEAIQSSLIHAMMDTRDPFVLPDIVPLLASPALDVREAALRAVGLLGDVSHVASLVKQLERVSPQEQRSVQDALARLSGQGTDGLIIEALKNARTGRMQVSLMRVLIARQCAQAVPVWKTLIWNPDKAVQTQAIQALGSLGDVTACAVLINALDGTESGEEREEIEKAINKIAERLSYPESLLDVMSSSLSKCDDLAKVSLYRAAGHFGSQQALVMVRQGLQDTSVVRDTCIRVLGKWPNSGALDDLLALAESAQNPTHRILALRGFASLYTGASDQTETDLVAMVARAFALAERPEEKKLLLAVLPATPNAAALRIVLSGLDDPALTEEAALALVSMAPVMPDEHRDGVKSALKQAKQKTLSPKVLSQINSLLILFNRPPNLAKGATASSPDGWDKDGAAGGDQAGIDSDPGTYWDEVNGKSEYRYRVTFDQSTPVNALGLMGYAPHNFAPRDFDIVCDGKVVLSVQKAIYVDNRFVVTFPATSCKTVELHITGSYGPSPAIRELELYYSAPSHQNK